MKYHGGVGNFVFIAGIVDTGDKLFTDVVDTGDKALFQVFIYSMTPAINLSPATRTPAIINPQ
jgi:hypothetical protein